MNGSELMAPLQVMAIQEQVEGLDECLVQPSRLVIKEGPLTCQDEPGSAFLFTDALLVCKRIGKSRLKAKHMLNFSHIASVIEGTSATGFILLGSQGVQVRRCLIHDGDGRRVRLVDSIFRCVVFVYLSHAARARCMDECTDGQVV